MIWNRHSNAIFGTKTPKEFNSFLAYPLDIDYKLVRLEDELCRGHPYKEHEPTYNVILYARRFISRSVNLDWEPRNSKNSIRACGREKQSD